MLSEKQAISHSIPKKTMNHLVGLQEIKALDSALIQVMNSGTVGDRFLMKMEINRLRKPCIRRIDMRGKINAECQVYEFSGITHFITTQAISFFEEMVRVYQGHYTTGVYESVFAEIENLLKPPAFENKDEVSSNEYQLYNVDKIGFGLYQTRSENRIFFNTDVTVSTNNQEFDTTTSDISCDGVRVLLPEHSTLEKEQVIKVLFIGLKKQYVDKTLNNYVSYRVVGIDSKDEKKFARAVRMDKEKNVNTFFTKFISAQQVFQRIDSSDTSPVLLNKGYEMLYTQKSSGLPVFFNDNDVMEHALVSDNNKDIADYWIDQDEINTLPFAFNKKLLTELRSTQPDSNIIYSLRYEKNNKIYFFVASHAELVKQKLFSTFITFSLSQGSLRIFKVTLATVVTNFEQLGLEADSLSYISKERLNKIKEVGVIHNITTDHYLEDLKYTCSTGNYKNTNNLKQFMLKGESTPLDIVPACFVSKRKSLRYMYKMELSANHDNNTYEGTSNNISVEGLCVELSSPIKAVTGDTINIIVPSSNLSSQPYRIVRINKAKNKISLTIASPSHSSANRAFFDELIKTNHRNMEADYGPYHTKGLIDGLSRLYSRYGGLGVLFMYQKNKEISSRRYATSFNNDLGDLMSTCSENIYMSNTYPITQSKLGEFLHNDEFLKQRKSDPHAVVELFICIEIKNDNICVITKLASELASPKLRKLFVESSRRRGKLFVIQAHTSKTNPLVLAFVDAHLSQLRRYAHYHINDVKKELSSIFASINLIDITKPTLSRLNVI